MEHQFAEFQIFLGRNSTDKKLPSNGEQILELLRMTRAVELIPAALENLRETGGALVIEQIDICGGHALLGHPKA